METFACSYENIDRDDNDDDNAKESWKPFCRQMLVSSGIWTCFFMYGLLLGTPTVLVPYERRNANSTEAVSKEMASWLSAAFGYASLPWSIVLPILVKIYGRKKPYIFMSLNTIVGVILFLTSQTIVQVLLSEIMQGVITSFIVTIGFLILTEYTSPKYRGLFLTIKSASFFWGIWVANAIGTFFHWKNIGILALILMFYNLITVVFWCESPYWLARKGRFEECASTHVWLKGTNREARGELIGMIKEAKMRLKRQTSSEEFSLKYIWSVFRTFLLKEFYKPLLLSLTVLSLCYTSGKLVCSIYSIDIFKTISGEESAYKGMLILDGVTVFAMYIGSGLSKILNRKTLLFGATSLGILFLFVLSTYLYLIKLGFLLEDSFVSLALLSAYSVSICCGPLIMSSSIAAELVPLKARSSFVCLNALGIKIAMSTLVKFSPFIFEWFGMHGTFLFYGISTSFSLCILYFYLPETKDKTINQIIDALNNKEMKEHKEMKELIIVKSSNTETK